MKKGKHRGARRAKAMHKSRVQVTVPENETPATVRPPEDSDAPARKPAERGMFVPYDENLLERARTQWQFGDWVSLSQLDRDTFQHHPDRAKLALLAAAGQMQLGDMQAARQLTRLAQEWGCSKRIISQILIAGVHNTLGRAALSNCQEQEAIRHFETAIAIATPQTDLRLFGQARTIRETAALGLLPQAARLMGDELSAMKHATLETSRLNIFETELELLKHELSLAQQRQQLLHPTSAATAEPLVEGGAAWLDALKKKSVSQLGQDLWVLEKTAYKREGYFVEFGATDGVLLSNTWLLEKGFDWQGICAEPNPKLFSQLKKNRECIVSDAYIGGETGEIVNFILADAYGSSEQYASDDSHSAKRAHYREAGLVTTLTAISLDDFLTKQGAPPDIDYLSIDTEGSELDILQSFPFDKWRIRLLTVEHNFTQRRDDIYALLSRHGYRRTESQWDDWYEKIDE